MRLIADENVRRFFVRGFLRRAPDHSFLEVHDVAMLGTADVSLLEWAAGNDVIIFSHDLATLVPLAWRRVEQGLPMPGVIFVPQEYPQRRALDLLVALVEVSTEADFADRVTYLTNFEGMVAR